MYFYFNGEKLQEFLNASNFHPIKYIGNDREGKEPFGVFCDFRIYPLLISDEKIRLMSDQELSIYIFQDKNIVYLHRCFPA